MGETRKSEMCTGYGLGPSCIACCVIVPLCKRNFVFETDFDIHFAKPADRMMYDCGIYEERKAAVFKRLEEGTKRFHEHPEIEKIIDAFKKAERIYATKEGIDEFKDSNEFKILLEEFFHKTGFIGLIDCKPGCLLMAKHKKYLPEECKTYLCDFAQYAEQNDHTPDLMQEFIQSDKPDSFGYSRIIHILAHHKITHKDLCVSIENLDLDQLKFLHEFVHRKSSYTCLKS